MIPEGFESMDDYEQFADQSERDMQDACDEYRDSRYCADEPSTRMPPIGEAEKLLEQIDDAIRHVLSLKSYRIGIDRGMCIASSLREHIEPVIRTEVTALKQDRKRLNTAMIMLLQKHPNVYDELFKPWEYPDIRAAIDALQKDGERLEAVLENGWHVHENGGVWFVLDSFDGDNISGSGHESFRAAIDSAMEATL